VCSGPKGLPVSTSRVRIAVPIIAITVMALGNAAPTAAPAPDVLQLDQILARFNRPIPPPYRAFRRLEAGKPDSSRHGWMEVWTEYRPGAGFSFEVVREAGSEYVRNKVLRGVLKGEQELLAEGKPLRAPLVPQNYQYEPAGLTDTGQVRLLLRPARKSAGIVQGTALLNPGRGTVEQIQGRLVKSPSFWVRDVDVTWNFARVDEAVLLVELVSSARVRIFGRHDFRMTYDYHSVDGRPLDGPTRASLRDR
jgi:hypothetical protein